MAQALGGISPWSPEITKLNTLQAELLVYWRLGDGEDEDKKILEDDAKHAQMMDEAMYGTAKTAQRDPLMNPQYNGFDYLEIEEE